MCIIIHYLSFVNTFFEFLSKNFVFIAYLFILSNTVKKRCLSDMKRHLSCPNDECSGCSATRFSRPGRIHGLCRPSKSTFPRGFSGRRPQTRPVHTGCCIHNTFFSAYSPVGMSPRNAGRGRNKFCPLASGGLTMAETLVLPAEETRQKRTPADKSSALPP